MSQLANTLPSRSTAVKGDGAEGCQSEALKGVEYGEWVSPP